MPRSPRLASGRHAGLLLPLFSAPSRTSWGIGEIADLPILSAWLGDAGFDVLQILPLNEMQTSQHSPYAAVSAMAIDPIYVSLRDVPEFQAAGGEAALSPDRQRRAADVRASPRIDYNTVRALKMEVLRAAFEIFRAVDWTRGSARAARLREYLHRERWWIRDYVLYRALGDERPSRPWWEWEPALARRDPRALSRARRELAGECLFHGYVQWLADTQWQEARRAASPVAVLGDVSFMVGGDSADVWANQHAFRLDATVGAPPDAFSETGQDWGLPAYRWDVFAAGHDAWIRDRAARNAALFDGYRIDHVVGFYRTFVIPAGGGEPAFDPLEEPAQLAQGERVLEAFVASGARIIAEDLGVVPDFVRASLRRLGIPGYKVLRWERAWDAPGHPFTDPGEYPRLSVATTGTHDTKTLVEWWETATGEERAHLARIPFLAGKVDPASAVCDGATRDVLLEALVASASDLLLLPIQDVFGWRDRINVPATVTEDNWTWRLPWPVEELREQPEARARAATLSGWMRLHARTASSA